MDISKMKNIIVLKNLPSNIIDEAFVVLKANKKIKSLKSLKENSLGKNEINNKDHIVKEAEMIISNYINETDKINQLKLKSTKELEKKYKKLKSINIFLWIVVAILIFTKIA